MILTTNCKNHWEGVYSKIHCEQVGWYRPHLETSFEFVVRADVGKNAEIIDIGGGASTLADDLLNAEFKHICVLDIAAAASEAAKLRIGNRAEEIEWINGDILQVSLPESRYDVWHDRAVFHFLTDSDDRKKYAAVMRNALKPKAHIIIAAFSPEAPPKCSGLDVVRYTTEQLHAELGEDLKLVESRSELHITPGGVRQKYIYCHFER